MTMIMAAAVLVTLVLAGCCAHAGAPIIGINVDIEDYKHQELYLSTVSHCTAMVASANLSLHFSASVQTSAVYSVGLPNPSFGAGVLAVPTEPYYQQILRAVDDARMVTAPAKLCGCTTRPQWWTTHPGGSAISCAGALLVA